MGTVHPTSTKRIRNKLAHILGAVAAIVVLLALAAGVVLHLHPNALNRIFGSHVPDGPAATANLHLPSGFTASVVVSDLNAPRFITFGPQGALFVADSGSGRIVAYPHPGSATSAEPVVVASGLNSPTSLVFHDGALYVGEASRVSRLTLDSDLKAKNVQVVVPNLPTGGNHVTRTVLFGPDGNLYVSIGSTCNNCVETDPHRAVVMVYHPDGSGGRVYAHGLRNAVGMAINPFNQQIWLTDNGRDLLGDNTPPETIYALQDGGNYGWPVCQAGTIVDPDLGHPGDCTGVVQPLLDMQAHSAPLGLAFQISSQFPAAYRGLFVAFHGSWNRSVPTGYKVVFIPLTPNGQVAGPARDFATGWLVNSDTASGRPVGLAVGPDGALYVSDDKGGRIYRIAYTG